MSLPVHVPPLWRKQSQLSRCSHYYQGHDLHWWCDWSSRTGLPGSGLATSPTSPTGHSILILPAGFHDSHAEQAALYVSHGTYQQRPVLQHACPTHAGGAEHINIECEQRQVTGRQQYCASLLRNQIHLRPWLSQWQDASSGVKPWAAERVLVLCALIKETVPGYGVWKRLTVNHCFFCIFEISGWPSLLRSFSSKVSLGSSVQRLAASNLDATSWWFNFALSCYLDRIFQVFN